MDPRLEYSLALGTAALAVILTAFALAQTIDFIFYP